MAVNSLYLGLYCLESLNVMAQHHNKVYFQFAHKIKYLQNALGFSLLLYQGAHFVDFTLSTLQKLESNPSKYKAAVILTCLSPVAFIISNVALAILSLKKPLPLELFKAEQGVEVKWGLPHTKSQSALLYSAQVIGSIALAVMTQSADWLVGTALAVYSLYITGSWKWLSLTKTYSCRDLIPLKVATLSVTVFHGFSHGCELHEPDPKEVISFLSKKCDEFLFGRVVSLQQQPRVKNVDDEFVLTYDDRFQIPCHKCGVELPQNEFQVNLSYHSHGKTVSPLLKLSPMNV